MIERIRTSLRLTWEELIYKVTWPGWDDLQSSAIVVLVASLLIAMVVFGMDTVSENVSRFVYKFFE
jgi:preprotein translocase subunit SecE